MAGRNVSKKKGLFAGFLSGTAMCLCLGAAAAYVSPIEDVQQESTAPSVETSGTTPVSPKRVTTKAAVTTPKSDTPRDVGEAPSAETPPEDRDTSRLGGTLREVSDPIQTNTPSIEAPAVGDDVDAQTAKSGDQKPKSQAVVPLSTTETAPEQSTAQINLPSEETSIEAPKAEESGLEQLAEESAPITLALNAPKVETPNPAVKPLDLDVSTKPAETQAPKPAEKVEKPKLAAPKAPTVPRAEPIIALNKPASKASETKPRTAQSVPDPVEAKQAEQTALITPQSDEGTPRTPKAEPESAAAPAAPKQVQTPVVDTEPEAPIIEQAAVVPPKAPTQDVAEEKDEAAAIQADEPNVVNRRNPPAPTFEGRAFDAFAVKFVPPNNKPFLTVVLEHVGEGSVDMYDLLNFGQPITFGVNSADVLANWRENEFRKAGFEVVALVAADEDAVLTESLDDDAIALRVDNYLEAVPGAVALLDRSDSDLYRDPRKVNRVAEELNLTGRGLLVHEKFGINRALEAARSVGIPAASLVRIIDKQRDAASIRRALDRASLDASKTGAAIVFGRTHPETVAALLPWLLGNSARAVTLAPLTSTMKRMVE